MEELAISVENITKLYKLYDKPSDRLKESLGLTKKKHYKEHYALHDLSFNVKKGECVGIIGTNGAGKSTILKIITGVLNPTEGEVKINGRISALLELGAGFNNEYTGLENVYLNGTMIGFSREEIDSKLDDILKFADIGDFINQPVKTYSSGMFVRLAFAVAINIDPEILIVDEALSVGDVFFQAKCYHKFEEFKKMGKTIVFVSHDLGSVNKYCDRVVLLDKGRKREEGNPKEMIDLYKKILVGQGEDDADAAAQGSESSENQNNIENKSEKENAATRKKAGKGNKNVADNKELLWKSKMTENPNCSVYGNGDADIIDYCITDEHGNITNMVNKGENFVIKMKVRFNNDVNDPIMAFTIRDKQGTEIAGTNTMYEDVNTGMVKAGTIKEVSFTQKLDLKGGEYLICLGCTGFVNGSFEVYSRLYEVCVLQVLSSKNIVGFYDMNTTVTVD